MSRKVGVGLHELQTFAEEKYFSVKKLNLKRLAENKAKLEFAILLNET